MNKSGKDQLDFASFVERKTSDQVGDRYEVQAFSDEVVSHVNDSEMVRLSKERKRDLKNKSINDTIVYKHLKCSTCGYVFDSRKLCVKMLNVISESIDQITL